MKVHIWCVSLSILCYMTAMRSDFCEWGKLRLFQLYFFFSVCWYISLMLLDILPACRSSAGPQMSILKKRGILRHYFLSLQRPWECMYLPHSRARRIQPPVTVGCSSNIVQWFQSISSLAAVSEQTANLEAIVWKLEVSIRNTGFSATHVQHASMAYHYILAHVMFDVIPL